MKKKLFLEEQKADRLVCGHFIVVIEWLTGWVNTQQYLLDYRMKSRALLEVESNTVSVPLSQSGVANTTCDKR